MWKRLLPSLLLLATPSLTPLAADLDKHTTALIRHAQASSSHTRTTKAHPSPDIRLSCLLLRDRLCCPDGQICRNARTDAGIGSTRTSTHTHSDIEIRQQHKNDKIRHRKNRHIRPADLQSCSPPPPPSLHKSRTLHDGLQPSACIVSEQRRSHDQHSLHTRRHTLVYVRTPLHICARGHFEILRFEIAGERRQTAVTFVLLPSDLTRCPTASPTDNSQVLRWDRRTYSHSRTSTHEPREWPATCTSPDAHTYIRSLSFR